MKNVKVLLILYLKREPMTRIHLAVGKDQNSVHKWLIFILPKKFHLLLLFPYHIVEHNVSRVLVKFYWQYSQK